MLDLTCIFPLACTDGAHVEHLVSLTLPAMQEVAAML